MPLLFSFIFNEDLFLFFNLYAYQKARHQPRLGDGVMSYLTKLQSVASLCDITGYLIK